MTYDGVEEASLLIPKSLQDVQNMNCSAVGNDILSGKASHYLLIITFQSMPV